MIPLKNGGLTHTKLRREKYGWADGSGRGRDVGGRSGEACVVVKGCE